MGYILDTGYVCTRDRRYIYYIESESREKLVGTRRWATSGTSSVSLLYTELLQLIYYTIFIYLFILLYELDNLFYYII